MLRGANLKTLSKEVREGKKKNNCLSYSWSSNEYDTDTLETSDENDFDCDIDDLNSSNEAESRTKERTETPERDRRPDQGFSSGSMVRRKSSFASLSSSPVSLRTPTHTLSSTTNRSNPYPLLHIVKHKANSSHSSDSYE